jgi:hypothetical protein
LVAFFSDHKSHCSKETIKSVFREFLAKQDEEEISLLSCKKGNVGRKSSLTPDLSHKIQQRIDKSITYRELATGLQAKVKFLK